MSSSLADRVAAADWYHTLDLPSGVQTPGFFDLRPVVGAVPMPASLAGKRCLDVGTWDGFWAFEMERRGAASVTAVDLDDPGEWDWPPHTRLSGDVASLEYLRHVKSGDRAFDVAHEALGSKVERVIRSVYDLSPDDLGTFDFVFMGSLLLHLRDPVSALDHVRSVCGGEAVFSEAIDLVPSLLRPRTPLARLEGLDEPWWWQPNVAGLDRMVRAAGFDVLERTRIYRVRLGASHPRPPLRELVNSLRTARDRERAIVRLVDGLPHVAMRVRPAAGSPAPR